MRSLVTALLCCIAFAAAGAQAPATSATGAALTDSALEAQTRLVASQLRCPVCQGLSLQDSPSELSQEMKDVVRQQLAAGKSPDEVKRYFIGKYGEWILMQPTARSNWAVYVLPPLVLLLGGAVVVVAVRRWTAGAPGDAPSGPVA